MQIGIFICFSQSYCVHHPLFHSDLWVARTVVAVLGKGFAVAAFCTIVLYSSELYPTVLR